MFNSDAQSECLGLKLPIVFGKNIKNNSGGMVVFTKGNNFSSQKIKENETLVPLYQEQKFRQYKWYSYINKKRTEDNMVNKNDERGDDHVGSSAITPLRADAFDISDEEMENAILKSVSYAKKPNPEGLKLQKQFTYEKTVETILCAISSQM